ncbi:MAG TPA: bluetail domain-containing putative surface protein [Trichocoleus sp.]|jgi:nitrous oxidase accessory protein NosD
MANSLVKGIVVTSTADSGAGSLRSAITLAPAGETIRFAPSLKGQTITLNGQLEVNKNLTIDGSNAPGLTISGNNASRVLKTGEKTNVTLKNLILANGRLTGADDVTGTGAGIQTGMDSTLTVIKCQINRNVARRGGGGIWTGYRSTTTILNSRFDGNDGSEAIEERGGGAIATTSGGTLTVRGSSFTNNRGSNGGAINNLLTQLLVENCTFRNNDSTVGGVKAGTIGYGGAIYVDGADPDTAHDVPGAPGRTITIRNSRVEGNRGAAQGGGMMIWLYGQDKALVENCSITGNSVSRGAGGDSLGGGLRHGNGELTIRNTTIANNTALDQGGGLWIGGRSPVTITNSTISGNRADNGNGQGLGGAITLATDAGYVASLKNLTITNNYAGFGGGAFWANQTAVTLANSIVANNSTSNPWKLNSQTGWQLMDGGNNIQFPAPLSPSDKAVTATVRVIDPRLALLQTEDGSLAPTQLLLKGSPAIDGAGSTATPTDQRGIGRNGKPDIGATEWVTNRNLKLNGTAANDLLIGSSGQDNLTGATGDDWLMGSMGSDRLTGNQGADYFVFAASSQAQVFRQSRLKAIDHLTDWKVQEGDRLLLDTDNDSFGDQPVALFHAKVSGNTLASAVKAAYQDKNQQQRGQQKLQANEAVLLEWNRRSFLAVNDQSSAFSANRDLLVDVTGIKIAKPDVRVGVLAVDNYFA